ncbi:MAG: TrmH family RNA methyltransferase [Myxococcota bacterium]
MARIEEDKVYGERAVRAAFARRVENIVRVYVDEARVNGYRALLREAAQRRIAYKVVAPEDVAAFAGSRHHEGICILAKPTSVGLRALVERAPASPCILALDGVQNPHNLGAVARSAAHFGVDAIVRCREDGRWTGAAFRTAEGGAEFVDRVAVRDLADALGVLRDAGYSVIGLDSEARHPLYDVSLTDPTALVLGNEAEGLSRSVRTAVSRTVCLPGTQSVQSLNISNAAAVAMAEAWRQRSSRGTAVSGRRRPHR